MVRPARYVSIVPGALGTVQQRGYGYEYLLEAARSGLSAREAASIMEEFDPMDLAQAADRLTLEVAGDTVTFVNNLVVNYTNVCVAGCKICAFYRPPGHPEGYVRSPEEVARLVARSVAEYGITELHINGGFHPDLGPEYFDELFGAVKAASPGVAIKGLTAAEVEFYSRVWRMSYREVLDRLRRAGMDALSGGGAEILDDGVRRVIAPYKFDAEKWLRVQEEAHEVGIPTNATMLYGHIEEPRHIVEHISKVRDLQRKLRGVLTFIPVKFVPWNTELMRDGLVRGPAPPELDIKVAAISRLMLAGEVPRISAYWVSVGRRMASVLLLSGANDLVGTMINESVLRSAGSGESASLEELAHIAREVGRRPVQRDTFQRALREL
jgi:CofH subfamily radical SAM domain protein